MSPPTGLHDTPAPPDGSGPAAPWAGWRWLAWAAALAALLAIFGLYTDPHFMVDLADQLWACF